MRKSVTAFVFGLIGSVFSLMWGFIFGIVGDSVSCIASNVGTGVPGEFSILLVLGWICFIGGIIGIIGASNCFKRARKGGIILAVATVACGSLLVYLFVQSIRAGSEMVPTLILLFLLPAIFLIVATISAFIAKETTPATQPNIQYAPQMASQGKTLEQELTELKNMVDKGLITNEEFDQAKKSILEKHTK